jgi:hypothetical protein
MELATAAQLLQQFAGRDLGLTLSRIESALSGESVGACSEVFEQYSIDRETLEGAALLKSVAGQINVAIHALGIALCLPHILDSDEVMTQLSLGAGNTGKLWDLETDRRIAEFKFISWRGGPEAIRQNSVFKDFFYLAEYETDKSRHLYVLGTDHPLKFLRGRRALSSVLSRNAKLERDFRERYPDLRVVSDYYFPRRDLVGIEDISPYVGELVSEV